MFIINEYQIYIFLIIKILLFVEKEVKLKILKEKFDYNLLEGFSGFFNLSNEPFISPGPLPKSFPLEKPYLPIDPVLKPFPLNKPSILIDPAAKPFSLKDPFFPPIIVPNKKPVPFPHPLYHPYFTNMLVPFEDLLVKSMNKFRNNFKIHSPKVLVFGHKAAHKIETPQLNSNQLFVLPSVVSLLRLVVMSVALAIYTDTNYYCNLKKERKKKDNQNEENKILVRTNFFYNRKIKKGEKLVATRNIFRLNPKIEKFMIAEVIEILDEKQGLLLLEFYLNNKWRFKNSINYTYSFIFFDEIFNDFKAFQNQNPGPAKIGIDFLNFIE